MRAGDRIDEVWHELCPMLPRPSNLIAAIVYHHMSQMITENIIVNNERKIHVFKCAFVHLLGVVVGLLVIWVEVADYDVDVYLSFILRIGYSVEFDV